uniref:G-protein coupled receptors family 1 profile domain-containing protein n=1 Tax=Echeneis naucrates TaxID=173247 RepID=A0A665VLK1_ECHNA
MADFNMNTSQNQSCNDSYIIYNNSTIENVLMKAESAMYVRKDHIAPIFIINLLISDLIQVSFMIVELARPEGQLITFILLHVYSFSLGVSVGFIVCIALERYLVITRPLWYRLKRTIKIPLVACVVVWTLPLFLFLPIFSKVNIQAIRITIAVLLLLPLPLFIFFLVGTFKALSAAKSVPLEEKRRIVAILIVVTLIYGLLFLPSILRFFALEDSNVNIHFLYLSLAFVKLSPLADLFLYVFMRKGFVDKLLASLCCCKMDNHHYSSVTKETFYYLS